MLCRQSLNDVIKKLTQYPRPPNFNKKKTFSNELNQDKNQTKSQLLALIDEIISNYS